MGKGQTMTTISKKAAHVVVGDIVVYHDSMSTGSEDRHTLVVDSIRRVGEKILVFEAADGRESVGLVDGTVEVEERACDTCGRRDVPMMSADDSTRPYAVICATGHGCYHG